jgi:hypothetical protein
MAACLCQGRVPGCAPGGAVTFSCFATGSPAERKSPKRRRPRCPCPLRGNLRCAAQSGVRANSLHCVALKQRAALIRLKLCSSARPEGIGSPTAFRAIAALCPTRRNERGAGGGARFRAAQALGVQCNCRIMISRSETRAPTPIPECWAQRGFIANPCLQQCITVEMTSSCCRPRAEFGQLKTDVRWRLIGASHKEL